MRTPGFTAAASLNKRGEYCEFAADRVEGIAQQAVIPQITFSQGPCQTQGTRQVCDLE